MVPTKMMFYVPASGEKKNNGPNMKQTNMKLSVKGKGSLPSLLLSLMAPSAFVAGEKKHENSVSNYMARVEIAIVGELLSWRFER